MPDIVPKDECAIISRNMSQIDILLPKDREGIVPEVMAFMIAIAMRYEHDQEFVKEQLDWLAEQVQ